MMASSSLEADGAQEGRRQELAAAAAAVEVDVEQVVGVELHLQPRTAVRDDAEAVEELAVEVHARLEAYAGGAVQLRDDDALRAVDDERSALGHERQLAHVDLLLLRPDRLVLELESHVQGRAERLAVALGLERCELGRADLVLHEVEVHLLVIRVDGEDLFEDRLEAGHFALARSLVALQELLVGLDLDLDEVRGIEDFVNSSEV